jgi:hypothetical protein
MQKDIFLNKELESGRAGKKRLCHYRRKKGVAYLSFAIHP